MIIGNNYISLSIGEYKKEKEITKFIHINFILISLMVQLEETYIMFTLSLFKKIEANITLSVN
jgi:hypothetical protein|tara:strand:- start:248 stop:436 length:189 start_codon:yes stop_codon:yes gene_type:complete